MYLHAAYRDFSPLIINKQKNEFGKMKKHLEENNRIYIQNFRSRMGTFGTIIWSKYQK